MHQTLPHQVKYSENPRVSPRLQAIQGNLDGLKGEISRERIKEEIKRDEEEIIDWLEDWIEKGKGFGSIDTKLTVNAKKILAPIIKNIVKVYEYLYGKAGVKELKDLLESPDEAPFMLSIGYKYIPGQHRYSIPSIILRSREENTPREKNIEKN